MIEKPYVKWGTATLLLDATEFRKGFYDGRLAYSQSVAEDPLLAQRLTTQDVLNTMSMRDKNTGLFILDQYGLENTENYLGVLVGFLSGPLIAENEQEQAKRMLLGEDITNAELQ